MQATFTAAKNSIVNASVAAGTFVKEHTPFVKPAPANVTRAEAALVAGGVYFNSLFGKIDFNSMSEAALLEDIKKEEAAAKAKQAADAKAAPKAAVKEVPAVEGKDSMLAEVQSKKQ